MYVFVAVVAMAGCPDKVGVAPVDKKPQRVDRVNLQSTRSRSELTERIRFLSMDRLQ